MLNSNVKLWLQICLLNIMEFLLVWQHWQVWKDWTQYYHVYFSQGEQCWLYALAIQLCEITSHSFRWCQGHCGYTRMCVVVLLHQPSLQRSVVLHCSNFCATIISYVTISGARSQLIFSDVFLYVMMHLTTLTV